MTTLHDRPSIEGHPIIEGSWGPPWIDAETVAETYRQIEGGIVSVPPNIGELVEGIPQAVFEDMFARYLANSPLASPNMLAHRAYALAATLIAVVKAASEGRDLQGKVARMREGDVQIALDALQIFLATTAQQIPVPQEHQEWVASEVAMLDAETVSRLTGIAGTSLASWRMTHDGPPWVKLAGQRRSVRYPVSGLIVWLTGRVQ